MSPVGSTGRGKRTVDLHLAVSNNLLDLTLLLEVLEAAAGKRAVDLETVDEGGDGDKAVGLDVLVKLVGSGLVKDDGVLGLVLDCGCVSVNLAQSFGVVGDRLHGSDDGHDGDSREAIIICWK